MADRALKQQRLNSYSVTISFREKDRKIVLYQHNNALVIIIFISNYKIQRVLVENRGSVDILFWDPFIKMGFNAGRLRPSPTLLKGFSSDAIQPIGVITLLVHARIKDRMMTTMT